MNDPAQSTVGDFDISPASLSQQCPATCDSEVVSFPRRHACSESTGENTQETTLTSEDSDVVSVHAELGASHTLQVSTTATRIQMLWSRQQEWDARMRMIAQAQSFLYLSTFYIEWGERAKECLDALIHAQQRGVSTVLLIDQFGQRLGCTQMTRADRKQLRDRLQQLRDAGGQVVLFRPEHWIDRLVGGGQHVKIQISEHGEALFGSSNLSDQSFTGWNEFSVAVRGQISEVLLKNLQGLIGKHVEMDLSQPGIPAAETGPIALQYVAFSPTQAQSPRRLWRGSDNLISRLLSQEIDRATTQIDLSSFYFKPIALVRDALKRASDRGVRVRVYHSDRNTLSSPIPWLAAATDYRSLLDHGIEIYENTQGEHSKIILIDNRWAAFGSYNLEDAADDRLSEAMMITEDSELIEYFSGLLTQLQQSKDSHRLPPDTPERWPFGTRLAVKCFRPIKRWF